VSGQRLGTKDLATPQLNEEAGITIPYTGCQEEIELVLQVVADEYVTILPEFAELKKDSANVLLPCPLIKVNVSEIVTAKTRRQLSDPVLDRIGAGSFDGQV
jgi:hypothetical protein